MNKSMDDADALPLSSMRWMAWDLLRLCKPMPILRLDGCGRYPPAASKCSPTDALISKLQNDQSSYMSKSFMVKTRYLWVILDALKLPVDWSWPRKRRIPRLDRWRKKWLRCCPFHWNLRRWLAYQMSSDAFQWPDTAGCHHLHQTSSNWWPLAL